MKVAFYTLGCKVNLYETEYLMSIFKKEGYEIGNFEESCDIYIINTCTVTNQSDAKSRKMIHQVKKRNPNAILVACGCYIESQDRMNKQFDGIDIVVGNSQKSKIVELVKEYQKRKQPISVVDNKTLSEKPFEDMQIDHFEGKTRAFVKIQDGCENFCTYCIIPYVRGKCRSKKEELVLEEISTLVKKGYQEIVLTGIHTGHYGSDLNTTFSVLLKKILDIPSLKRIRISSIEITELDDDFLKCLENKIVCNHLHIPLQSGCDYTLKEMNRKYDTAYFLNKLKEIRSIRPDIAITTDIIVGFPGETEEHFNETLIFAEKCGFAKIHVFPYSKRDKTVAGDRKDQIDGNIKKRRVKELIALSSKLEKQYQEKMIGKKEKVLIEKYENGISYGHTSNYLYLKINTKLEENKIYEVEIKKENL